MLRAILAVIAGGATMVLFVVVTDGVVLIALGMDFVYNEGTYEPSTGTSVLSLVLALIAAVIGGIITASIVRTARPVMVLAGIVLVFGLLMAVMPQMPKDDETTEQLVRAEEESWWEAAFKSQPPPAWYNFTLPLVGCAGVVLGGRMRRRRGAAGSGGEA